jgi:streptogramin lyase
MRHPTGHYTGTRTYNHRRILVTLPICALMLASIFLFPMQAGAVIPINEFNLPSAGSTPHGIVRGPDGALWFTEFNGNRIGRCTTAGVITEYPLPTGGSGPVGIVTGPDGALWFVEEFGNRIGRCTTGGAITEYPVPTGGSMPAEIAVGPDGALWFTEWGGNKVGRCTTGGAITEYPIPTVFSQPWGIAAGPDGALWFTEFNGNKIGRCTTAGAVTEYPVPTGGSQPSGIAAGPDGSVWFVEQGGNKVGRCTTAGAILEYNISTGGSVSYYIAPGPDVSMWFTESNVSKLGRIDAPSYTWYLAEGSTAWGFWEYITIENPIGSPVQVDVTYMPTGAAPVTVPNLTLPPMSQTTLNPRDTVGEVDFSTKVVGHDPDVFIAVDRTMSWTGPGAASEEGHSSVGVTTPSTTWYLPEGSTEWGFECWLCIQNPDPVQTAHCTVTYMIENTGPVSFNKTVGPHTRATFNVAEDIGAKDASIEVRSDVGVIPERAMYRNHRREGHDSVGTTAPSYDFYLAEGSTAWGFTTYVCVQNPNSTPTDVTITYNTQQKGPQPQAPFTMQPGTRETIRVNDVMPDVDVSTYLHGSQPIIAERAMYWDFGSGEATHDSIGMPFGHHVFLLPDGQTSEGRETWTCVQNPNPDDAQITIWYLTPDSIGIVNFNDVVPAGSRKSYNMADRGINGRAAVGIASDRPIMAERAMYWSSRGAGTNTIGGCSD